MCCKLAYVVWLVSPSTVACVALLTVAAEGPASKPEPKPEPKPEKVEVEDVLGTLTGQFVVILRTVSEPRRFLPIWIGQAEAASIRMRMDRRQPPRPLTLNLLESIMATAGIELTEISIDDLKGGVFLGRIRLTRGTRHWYVDARPSDAIGLAVGKSVPIWVAPGVLEEAAIDPGKLKLGPPTGDPDGGGTDSGDPEQAPEPAPTYEETL